MREVVEEVAFQARADRKIDKRSGVSQRLPITTLELVVSNAERRALANGEGVVVPRVTDVYAALPSITGKFELEYEGELRGAEQVARDLIRSAVGTVFTGIFDGVDTRTRRRMVRPRRIAAAQRHARRRTTSSRRRAASRACASWRTQAGAAPGRAGAGVASAIDFVLEGLYAQKKISRSEERGYCGRRNRRAPSDAPRRTDDRRRDPDSGRQEEELSTDN